MGLGFMEIVIIGVVSLVLLGPQRLPGLMRQAAKFYVQMRRTSNEFKSAFDHVVEEAEREMPIKPDLSLGSKPFINTHSPEKAAFDALEKSLPLDTVTISRPDQPFAWGANNEQGKNT